MLPVFPTPPSSKRAVNKAGKAIANGSRADDDFELVDQWRSAHGYVLNTFQIFLKRRIAQSGIKAEFAQRLKRRHTVIDKLGRKRPDGSPLMGDVTSMHDFAGCRLIFPDIKELQKFRDFLHSSESLKTVRHQLRHERSKYDYIENPKSSGYRGIHDIFAHRPRPHRRSGVNSQPWHDLLVEVQYRTHVQHAWATALEISDILDNERTKFDLTDSDRVRFFSIASELLARKHEGLSKSFDDLSMDQLRDNFLELDQKLGILSKLDALKKVSRVVIKKHNVLNLTLDKRGKPKLEVLNFRNAAEAIEAANALESSTDSINAVYVHADNPKQLQSAYRNYFNNPVDFVKLIKRCF
jgi:putative GTP pyrophosphokinase